MKKLHSLRRKRCGSALLARAPLRLVALALLALQAAGCESPAAARGRRPPKSASPRSAVALPAIDGTRAHPARLILVAVPGLEPSHYLPSGAAPDRAPNLRQLAEAGVAAVTVEGVAPEAIYPASASAITGRLPGAHGIPVDSRVSPRGAGGVPASRASELRAPTLWQRAAEGGLAVAALGWPTTEGAAFRSLISDREAERPGDHWLDLIGAGGGAALTALLQRGAETRQIEALDTPGPARDAALTEVACSWLTATPGPALTLIRLSGLDATARREGPHSHAAELALAEVDARVGTLLRCSARGVPLEQSAVIVIGLRGVRPVHTQIAANALLARAGLLAPGQSWSAIAASNGGSAFVYAKSERAALRARSELLAEAQRSRAFRIVSAEELLPLGADPEAWFGLRAEPGYRFSDAVSGAVIAASEALGEAGYLPDAATGGWIAWGRGLRAGLQISRMRLTDTAPTAALLLGIELAPESELDGRALIGALALPGMSPASVRGGLR
jgi:hypothetical protein